MTCIMLRLIYLLIRQRARRRAGNDAGGDRERAGIVAVALTACAGVAVVMVLTFPPFSGMSMLALARTQAATLTIDVEAVRSAPLVFYLEAPGTTPTQPSQPAAPPARITSVNSTFEPAFQVAPVAADIEVHNADPIPHNTHIFKGERTLFNVAIPRPGVRVHKLLSRAGILDVHCDFHPWMRAWIFVAPGPHHAVLWQAEEVTMRDIPPGDYQLHSWTPIAGQTTRTVTLQPGETLSLHIGDR